MERERYFREFDKQYEELEVQPYNSSKEYFDAGWDSAIKEIKERLSSCMSYNEILLAFRKLEGE